MSRLLTIIGCCALLATPAALGGSQANVSWAQPQIKVVVSHGLMARTVVGFRADDTLTQGELAAVVAGLTKAPAAKVADPSAPVTVTQLDARLVRTLGLSDTVAAFNAGARAVGLATPSRFGTETVARLLGLRTNHPAGQDDLELLPSEPVTRAETAYSIAQILRLKGWETDFVEEAAASFELPELNAWQTKVLNTAVRFIGYPYV